MTRISKTRALMLTAGLYLLSTQQSFAQSIGHSGNISFRGVVVFLVTVAGAYWLAGRYFKSRPRKDGAENGFQLPAEAWFVIAAVVAAIGNVLFMMWMTSFDARHQSLLIGTLGIFYFILGWTIPGTVVAFSQMMQRSPPEGLAEAHGNVLLPTLGGYYLTMLWGNDIARTLDLRFF